LRSKYRGLEYEDLVQNTLLLEGQPAAAGKKIPGCPRLTRPSKNRMISAEFCEFLATAEVFCRRGAKLFQKNRKIDVRFFRPISILNMDAEIGLDRAGLGTHQEGPEFAPAVRLRR